VRREAREERERRPLYRVQILECSFGGIFENKPSQVELFEKRSRCSRARPRLVTGDPPRARAMRSPRRADAADDEAEREAKRLRREEARAERAKVNAEPVGDPSTRVRSNLSETFSGADEVSESASASESESESASESESESESASESASEEESESEHRGGGCRGEETRGSGEGVAACALKDDDKHSFTSPSSAARLQELSDKAAETLAEMDAIWRACEQRLDDAKERLREQLQRLRDGLRAKLEAALGGLLDEEEKARRLRAKVLRIDALDIARKPPPAPARASPPPGP
jgi:hypothetical protein